jgi:uncharacterized protein (UPF0332 family)
MTDNQIGLIEKARESLQAAKLLAGKEHWGFAASRAYYTMFYVVEALLLGEGLEYSKHSAVIAAFGERFAKTRRVTSEFHRMIIEAQDSRNAGDYDIHPGVTPAVAAEQIANAGKFLELAAQLLGSIPDESSGTTAKR